MHSAQCGAAGLCNIAGQGRAGQTANGRTTPVEWCRRRVPGNTSTRRSRRMADSWSKSMKSKPKPRIQVSMVSRAAGRHMARTPTCSHRHQAQPACIAMKDLAEAPALLCLQGKQAGPSTAFACWLALPDQNLQGYKKPRGDAHLLQNAFECIQEDARMAPAPCLRGCGNQRQLCSLGAEHSRHCYAHRLPLHAQFIAY